MKKSPPIRLHRDLREFVELLNAHRVEYLVAGAFCLALHGRPRFTGDLDLFISSTIKNADRIMAALRAFGFGKFGLRPADFIKPGQVIQLGIAPYRIDLLTSLDGVNFKSEWKRRKRTLLDGVPCFFLGRTGLIRNKLATGRPQDLVDVESLLGHSRRKGNRQRAV